jgi:hypothetical protein
MVINRKNLPAMNKTRRVFLKQAAFSAAGIGLAPLLTQCKSAGKTTSARAFTFDRVSPESQGVASGGILDFIRAADDSNFEWHSFMLLRHGNVIAEGWWEPFAPAFRHTLYSLSKSFTSTAVGLAIDEGKLRLDDKVISFFPDQLPEVVSDNLKAMRIRDLLTMTTGHSTDSFPAILQRYEKPWVPTFLSRPVEYEPGTHFVYNTGATFMLSAIVQKVTGQPVEDFLKPRLFDPLGITAYDWEKSPEGVNAGGFGLRVNTEAIARFGQLYLQNGQWQGRQVFPAEWVREATKKQTDSYPGDGEWSQGYGYQFWRCKPETVYRGDGAYGQFCIVMPKYDAVMAVTSESWDMAKSLEIIFDHLLPAFSDAAIPGDAGTQDQLKAAASRLQLPVSKGSKASERSAWIRGKKFRMDDNPFGVEAIRFHFENGQCVLEWTAGASTRTIKAGMGNWHLSDDRPVNPFPVFFRTDVPSRIAATATWTAPDTLQIHLKFVEGIHGDTYTCRFEEKTVEMNLLNSVAEHDSNERNKERREVLKGTLVM